MTRAQALQDETRKLKRLFWIVVLDWLGYAGLLWVGLELADGAGACLAVAAFWLGGRSVRVAQRRDAALADARAKLSRGAA